MNTEKGKRAADAVREHLRRYNYNARVLILAPDTNTLIRVCVDGPEGLMTHYAEEFPNSTVSGGQFQTNHERGGQIQGFTAEKVAQNAHRGQVFTMIWAENVESLGTDAHKSLEILEEVTGQLRTNELVRSLGGIII